MQKDRWDTSELSGYRVVAANLIVALCYAATGWLGLHLAVPPGYASVVWPASGIAVTALLHYGLRLAPGVFVGSLMINTLIGGVFGADHINTSALAVAAGIAAGSTLQACVAGLGARRLFGVPITFNSWRSALLFVALIGPFSTLIASSTGVITLFLAGIVPVQNVEANWFTWWLGDLIGVLVFAPLLLMAPWRPWSIQFANRPKLGLSYLTLLALIVPLGLTFYAWKFTSERSYERNLTKFEALAAENEKALLHRMNLYLHALDGGAGMLRGSINVTQPEWRNYVDALGIEATLPGINGIGYIVPVKDSELDAFIAQAGRDGVENLKIHPDTPAPANFIIRYIEPLAPNKEALGLNIAFESNRYNAATHARDSGKPTITQRIFLVQDSTRSAGFLLLRPMYKPGMPTDTVQQRQRAFERWVYAPFVGSRFMANLTLSQGASLNIAVFDGGEADASQLIYESAGTRPDAHYKVAKTISIMEKNWTLVWQSTPEFELSAQSGEANLVLAGGLGLTVFLAIYLLSLSRREDSVRSIVEQKTREIAARERENRALTENAVVGIALIDADGNILSANNAALKILNTDPEAVAGLPLTDALSYNSADGWLGLQDMLSKSSEFGFHTISVLADDGSERLLDVQLTSWKTEEGESRYTLVMSDVTLEQNVQKALRDTEERLQIALRGASIGVFEVDLTTGQSMVSRTWFEMLGIDENVENPQDEWRARIHPEDLKIVEAADDACISGRANRSLSDYRVRHQHGHWIWLRSDAVVPERDAQGTALRLIGTQTDITALKTAETALKESEERLRLAMENAPIGMAVGDVESGDITINPALADLLGYKFGKLTKQKLDEVTYLEDRSISDEHLQKLHSGEADSIQFEKRYIHRDGHIIWALVSASVARNESGEPLQIISQVQDISERKEMDRMKSEFISNVSHELRTPLTSIRGALGLVTGTMAAQIPDPVFKLLTIAHKNSERLIGLVNDLLDLEKLSAQKMVFDIRSEDLFAETVQAIESTQAYADQFNVAIEFLSPQRPIMGLVDKSRFHQVLANILSNAAKYSPQNGAVRVTIVERGDYARITVSDDGPGIPKDFHKAIFSPFSQADASATREKGGTGLGLHITRQMIERMGGTIGFETTEGVGTTFWFEVPLNVSSDARGGNTADNGLPLVLHVEDDLDLSELLRTALKDQLRVVTAPTFNDAKSRLKSVNYEMLVLDLELPDGNGLDLLEFIPNDCRKPIVILTASDIANPDPTRIDAVIVKSRKTESEIVALIRDTVLQRAKHSPEITSKVG